MARQQVNRLTIEKSISTEQRLEVTLKTPRSQSRVVTLFSLVSLFTLKIENLREVRIKRSPRKMREIWLN